MKETILKILRNMVPPPREVTAGGAIVSFEHDKHCRSVGMNFLDSADFLQIGSEQVYVYGGSGGWGVSNGTYVNETFIRCSACSVKKIFQER